MTVHTFGTVDWGQSVVSANFQGPESHRPMPSLEVTCTYNQNREPPRSDNCKRKRVYPIPIGGVTFAN